MVLHRHSGMKKKRHLSIAWTSQHPVAGHRHFQVVMQGGRGADRWVELAPVLAPTQRQRLPMSELRDRTRWRSGWQRLPAADEESAIE